jgi:hypothetical protein
VHLAAARRPSGGAEQDYDSKGEAEAHAAEQEGT